jgi:isoleucyl-tRNA synthetase
MSKSKGNVIDPFVAVDKYGSDAIRLYFFTVNQPGEPKRFDEKAVEDVTKKTFLILWNVLSFYEMYASESSRKASGDKAPISPNVLDRWILSELADLQGAVTRNMEAYNVIDAGRAIMEFITTLSTWYLRRSRDRFKNGTDEEKTAAVETLGYVLGALSGLLAPFTPFLADALYRRLGGQLESVHLEKWLQSKDMGIAYDEKLRVAMKEVQQAASLGLERRSAAVIPVRQVLASATVQSFVAFEEWMRQIVAEELNVREVRWSEKKDGGMQVELDTVLTPELKREGAAREFVRQVNDMRKGAKLTIKDRVALCYETTGEFWPKVLVEYGIAMRGDVLATELALGRKQTDQETEVVFDGESLWVGMNKV